MQLGGDYPIVDECGIGQARQAFEFREELAAANGRRDPSNGVPSGNWKAEGLLGGNGAACNLANAENDQISGRRGRRVAMPGLRGFGLQARRTAGGGKGRCHPPMIDSRRSGKILQAPVARSVQSRPPGWEIVALASSVSSSA